MRRAKNVVMLGGFLGCFTRVRALGFIVVACHDDMKLRFISLLLP